jgi:hypothetical protein
MSTCEPSLAMPVRSFLATVAAGKTHGVGGEVGATQPSLSRTDDSISILTPAALYFVVRHFFMHIAGMTSHEYFRAVTFGNLIKTFRPAWSGLSHSQFRRILLQLRATSPMSGRSRQQGAGVNGSDPGLSGFIFVGLLSNVVVFMGLNDFLVRSTLSEKAG